MAWYSRILGGQHGGVVVHEAEAAPAAAAPAVPPRGYAYGIPCGGTTEYDQGGGGSGPSDRGAALEELWDAYVACPWSSACVDAIARTITAGGVEVVWTGGDSTETKAPQPPANVLALRSLLGFVNPNEDIRQLTRGLITDLEVFGDAYLEVVWLAGEPAALYSLDVPSMRTIADEHGVVTKYIQITDRGQRAEFEPHEVIHISLDSPRSGINGLSPTQKALISITTWLFAAATLKETVRKGDPVTLHVDHPSSTNENDVKRWRQQYQTQNIGPRNIGNPVTTRGGANAAVLRESNIPHYIDTKTEARDEILSTYGCPPSKVGVIESGNLGGGTGTSQDKTFRVNTCGPIAEAVMEKLIYHLAMVGFGIIDWTMRFAEIDWRDDKTLDDIQDSRVRGGRMTINAARAEIGQPPVEGGDEAVIIDRQNMVLVRDLADLSRSIVTKNEGGSAAAPAPGGGQPPGTVGGGAKESTPAAAARALRESWERSYRQQRAIVLAEATGTEGPERTGAFVILRVSPDQASELAVPGGEPAEDLHVTIAYLTDSAADYDTDARASVEQAVSAAWADAVKPVTAEAFATANFNPDSGEDDDTDPCAVLLVQSQQLVDLHDAVCEQLDGQLSDRFPLWIPHITLGYGMTSADIAGRTGPVSFDQLRIAWGPDVTDL